MTRYEYLIQTKDKFEIAAARTTGYMQSIWMHNLYSIIAYMNSLSIEEAQEILK